MAANDERIVRLSDVRDTVDMDCLGILMCGHGGGGIAAIVAHVDGQSYVSVNRSWVTQERRRQVLLHQQAV